MTDEEYKPGDTVRRRLYPELGPGTVIQERDGVTVVAFPGQPSPGFVPFDRLERVGMTPLEAIDMWQADMDDVVARGRGANRDYDRAPDGSREKYLATELMDRLSRRRALIGRALDVLVERV